MCHNSWSSSLFITNEDKCIRATKTTLMANFMAGKLPLCYVVGLDTKQQQWLVEFHEKKRSSFYFSLQG